MTVPPWEEESQRVLADNAEGATPSDRSEISSLAEIRAIFDYLQRIAAEPRSMLTAVAKEYQGRYWRDVATIKLDKATGEIAVRCGGGGNASTFEPTELEAAAIKVACTGVKFPEPLSLQPGSNGLPPLPKELHDVDPKNIFAFYDQEGRVVMLQRRATDEEVSKGAPKYSPWSHWDDGLWRPMEPGGPLPLWGLPQLKEHTHVFLHEGAKAARAVAQMVAGETREDRQRLAAHPWRQALSNAAHLGWIGGALSPHRTDWSVLKKAGVTHVYIVSDNDEPGREAVPAIAKHLRLPTFHVGFTAEFPARFDLADELPEAMFGSDSRYKGPPFMALVEPATWATDIVVPERGGKPQAYLRDHFKHQWVYADEPELFICTADPRIVRGAANLSNKLVKFSDSPGTSRLLLKACDHVTTLAYAPDKPSGTVTVRGQRAFNVFRPADIKPEPGDAQPWFDFLAYLFPDRNERRQIERYCATLIARPQVRMHFGLLLVSKTQGVGKGILASRVLAPLVGDHNVGYPSEHDIAESAFNDWMAHKRLVVVGEIYQGSGWKAYNRLKGVITDKDFQVNKKHQTPYRIDNWCHVIACSNSDQPLKIEATDRRWFCPKVAEQPWTPDEFERFVQWLASGGLSIIAHWAAGYGDYVKIGEHPAMTRRKQVMIEESEAEELRWVREYCAGCIENGESIVISTTVAFASAKARGSKTLYSTKRAMGLAMEKAGMVQLAKSDGSEFTLKYLGETHRVFFSPAAQAEYQSQQLVGEALRMWLRTALARTQRELKESEPF